MDELESQFRPGAGAPPPAVVGRDTLLRDFRITLQHAMRRRPDKSMIPIGLRGIGKTVLLNRFAATADEIGMQRSFIEAPESDDFMALLVSHLRRCLLGLDRTGVTGAIVKALCTLKAFSVRLPDGTSFGLDLEAYEALARNKRPGESFSQVIKELFSRPKTGRDLAAALASVTVSGSTSQALDDTVARR